MFMQIKERVHSEMKIYLIKKGILVTVPIWFITVNNAGLEAIMQVLEVIMRVPEVIMQVRKQ